MSIPQWALESAVKGIITDAEKDGKVNGLVEETDRVLAAFFPGQEKIMKQILVCKVLIPYAKGLLKNDADGYEQAKTKF